VPDIDELLAEMKRRKELLAEIERRKASGEDIRGKFAMVKPESTPLEIKNLIELLRTRYIASEGETRNEPPEAQVISPTETTPELLVMTKRLRSGKEIDVPSELLVVASQNINLDDLLFDFEDEENSEFSVDQVLDRVSKQIHENLTQIGTIEHPVIRRYSLSDTTLAIRGLIQEARKERALRDARLRKQGQKESSQK